ncbi:hypothetical protein [Paludisphaera sp.]|uniref:hypothetical protein n=1 Tax=Paludisphaera sp. TaxID=2017432 RepID=UPI00301DE6C4
MNLVKKVRRMADAGAIVDLNQPCFLLFGDSRSGKTAMVKHLVRCIICKRLDEQTFDPCDGSCEACRQRPELSGLQGLQASLAAYGPDGKESIPIQFAVVDCTLIHTPEQLRDHLVSMSNESGGIRIFYFDEVHRLTKRGMDEMLLKAVEDKEAIWFFSTAKPDGLEDMFLNRLLKLGTEPPSEEEMACWLADRCNDWGIRAEPEAIMRVVEKSNRVVGTALHALAQASLDDDEGLTLDFVEEDWVVKLD